MTKAETCNECGEEICLVISSFAPHHGVSHSYSKEPKKYTAKVKISCGCSVSKGMATELDSIRMHGKDMPDEWKND